MDHVSQHHRRNFPSDLRRQRPPRWQGFLLGLFPRARGSREPRLYCGDDSKVSGKIADTSALLGEECCDQVVQRSARVSSARLAEAAKLMENVIRAVNTALVNGLKVICQGMGRGVWEVAEAAATKSFEFIRFNTWPG